jgi:hypothetical protein
MLQLPDNILLPYKARILLAITAMKCDTLLT